MKEYMDIALRYKNSLMMNVRVSPQEAWGTQQAFVMTLVNHLEGLGYTLSLPTQKALSHLDLAVLKHHSREWLDMVKAYTKASYAYNPLYPNFPEEYLGKSLSDYEVSEDPFGNMAFFGYRTNVLSSLRYAKKPTLLRIASVDILSEIFQSLLKGVSAWSDTDKETVVRLLDGAIKNPSAYVNQGMTNRENMAFVLAKTGWAHGIPDNAVITDALRIGAVLNNGDPSLGTATKMRFARPQRRELVRYMEQAAQGKEDAMLESMIQRRGMWLRFGEQLHVGEFKNALAVTSIFNRLRNDPTLKTFNAQVEDKFARGDVMEAVSLLVQRPGQFARQLVQCVRHECADVDGIEKAWAQVVDKVPTSLLVNVYSSLHDISDINMVFPKGRIDRAKIYGREHAALEQSVAERFSVLIKESLLRRFGDMPSMGKVYIDSALKNVPIPSAHRESSRALKTIPRGSRLALPDGDVLRSFVYWTEKTADGTAGSHRLDVDLSAVMLNRTFEPVGECSFASRGQGIIHSGDILSAPEGATEFVDVEFSKLPANVRYVMVMLNSYSGVPFAEMPECFMGWLNVDHAITLDASASGYYGRRTHTKECADLAANIDKIENRIDVTYESNSVVMGVIDVEQRQLLWLDVPAGADRTASSMYEKIADMIKVYEQRYRVSMYDLLSWHAAARGECVDTIVDDTVKVLDMNTVYDTLRVQEEFLFG